MGTSSIGSSDPPRNACTPAGVPMGCPGHRLVLTILGTTPLPTFNLPLYPFLINFAATRPLHEASAGALSIPLLTTTELANIRWEPPHVKFRQALPMPMITATHVLYISSNRRKNWRLWRQNVAAAMICNYGSGCCRCRAHRMSLCKWQILICWRVYKTRISINWKRWWAHASGLCEIVRQSLVDDGDGWKSHMLF